MCLESDVCIWFAVWCVQLFVGVLRYLVEGDLIFVIFMEKKKESILVPEIILFI